MPWSIKTNAKGCDGFAVVKNGTNEPIPGGCHKTQGQAYKHLIALRLSYEERAQPRTPDGKFASTGGGGGGAPNQGGTGSKTKSAPKTVTKKGVNPDSEYVLSEKTGNFFKNPSYNGNPAGKGKVSPAGKNKSKQQNVDDLEGSAKFKATGQAKYKDSSATKTPAPAKPVSAKPASTGTKLSSNQGEITGDANAVKNINQKFQEQDQEKFAVLHNNVNKGQKPLTGQERADVIDYTGSAYSGLNQSLRNDHGDIKGDTEIKKSRKEYGERLDKAVGSRELAQDVAVSRRVSLETKTLKVGDEIYDPAFQSFSTDKKDPFGKGSSVIETVLPKGTRGMSVRSVSKYTSENEILLPAGFTAKVTSIRGRADGGKYITVDLVSQGVRKGSPPQPVRNLYVNKQRRQVHYSA
jgi:hypothetical protein